MARRPRIADWPARDRALWDKGVARKGLFESGGAGANWSETSRFIIARGYGYFLSWETTHPLHDPNLGPADRVTRERVEAYLAELAPGRAPYTILCRIQNLYDAMRAMAPEADWDWLSQLYRSVSANVHPVRDKRSRLRSIDELVGLGERLMKKAEATRELSAQRRAVLFRDGVAIALLAYRPVRLGNFASMRLGRHLIKSGASWQLLFSANETKSHAAYEAIVPSALAPNLERYLAVHRPVLLSGPANSGLIRTRDTPPHPGIEAVWVSEVGTHLDQHALACRIVKHTKAAFGHDVSPHLFRDCVASSIAVDNPKHIGDASLILGHADPTTTQKYYNHARSLEASRRHAATLAQLRRSLKQAPEG